MNIGINSLILVSFFSIEIAQAAPLYTITEVGTTGSASYASAIGEGGHLVGNTYHAPYWTTLTYNRAFIYNDEQRTDLGTLGAFNSQSNDVNSFGQTVGTSDARYSGDWRAFLYSEGTMFDLGTLGGSKSFGFGINDLSQIVGSANTTNDEFYHAFLYSNDYMVDLGTLGGNNSSAIDINQSSQVVGSSETLDNETHAFLYENGVMKDLGTLGGKYSSAAGINESGQVAGSSDTRENETHAFVHTNGVLVDLGTLGGTHSWAKGINSKGQVVGHSKIEGDTSEHAFLYSDGVMFDLNDLIDSLSGWEILFAEGINDRGAIAATGYKSGIGTHALLLELYAPSQHAVPEPAGKTLLSLGMAALILSCRRRLVGVRSSQKKPSYY